MFLGGVPVWAIAYVISGYDDIWPHFTPFVDHYRRELCDQVGGQRCNKLLLGRFEWISYLLEFKECIFDELVCCTTRSLLHFVFSRQRILRNLWTTSMMLLNLQFKRWNNSALALWQQLLLRNPNHNHQHFRSHHALCNMQWQQEKTHAHVLK